jgi:hypothetical protein
MVLEDIRCCARGELVGYYGYYDAGGLHVDCLRGWVGISRLRFWANSAAVSLLGADSLGM